VQHVVVNVVDWVWGCSLVKSTSVLLVKLKQVKKVLFITNEIERASCRYPISDIPAEATGGLVMVRACVSVRVRRV
jgi:hypothetical protein